VAGIATPKHGVAGNQYLGARLHHRAYGIKSDAPIHLNTEAKMPLGTQLGKMANLSQRPGDKFLSAKARIHRHHQYIIHNFEYVAKGCHRRRRIDHNSGQRAARADVFHHPVQVHASLLVHADPTGSRIP